MERRMEHNIAIVLSAGRGSRMHADRAKQYLDLCGRPVIAWSLQAFESFDEVDDVILVTGPEDIEYCRFEIVEKYGIRKVRSIVPGGAERYLSVWEGLKEARWLLSEAKENISESGKNVERISGMTVERISGMTVVQISGMIQDDRTRDGGSYVFIHDGARPLVDSGILTRTLEDARKYGACVAAMPVKDTIKVADENAFAVRTPDRRMLWQIQTPQVFSFSLVYEAYRKLIDEGITDVTDDAMVVERETSIRVKLTEGSWQNIKITTPEDLGIAGLFLETREAT